jgi:hypothetical protein
VSESSDFGLTSLDYWRLCDELTVVQAALLAAGCDPSDDEVYVENWSPENKPRGYVAARTGISNALRRGAIAGELIPAFEHDINGNVCGEVSGSIDVHASRVEVASLRTWLIGRGMKSGFFFPDAGDAPDYLDPRHPRYAPKLAAAIRAWLATENETAVNGKSPKQALAKWLREHASDFGLTDEEGKPNETGIEETAKVANWQLSGGAPKTPAE